MYDKRIKAQNKKTAKGNNNNSKVALTQIVKKREE